MEKLKQTIVDLKAAIKTAEEKQAFATEDCKRLQRDMDEFKNNKDGKIDELKVGFLFAPRATLLKTLCRPISRSRKRPFKSMPLL